jgi:hypothetical protein
MKPAAKAGVLVDGSGLSGRSRPSGQVERSWLLTASTLSTTSTKSTPVH